MACAAIAGGTDGRRRRQIEDVIAMPVLERRVLDDRAIKPARRDD